MRVLNCLLFCSFLFVSHGVFADPDATSAMPADGQASAVETSAPKDPFEHLEEPLYNPFLERYMLDELKLLRIDMAALRVELTEKLVDRDLNIGDKAMGYAANTVTYFFYLIAAVSSILVIVGWTSIRDIRDKVRSVADKEVQELVRIYEGRLQAIESQLTQKSQHIDENRDEIEKTQERHALWLRAAQEHAPPNKIVLYDEILKLRPNDCEALTYKADAVLEVGEPNWARQLCLQALSIDSGYGYAHYQLACAYAALGLIDDAIQSLREAIKISESFIDEAVADPALTVLRDYPEAYQVITRPEVGP